MEPRPMLRHAARLAAPPVREHGLPPHCFHVRIVLLAYIAASLYAAAPPQRSDLAIAEEIRARFAKSKIASNGFHVSVAKGVATLTGKTDIVQHKGTATRIAKSSGALQVVNNIEIGAKAREEAAQRLAAGRAQSASKHGAVSTKPLAGATVQPASPAPSPGSVPPPVRRARIKH